MTGATSPAQPLPVVLASALLETPPAQRWLIDSLWGTCDVGVIGGTPKSCKTWLGLDMAVSVASATPCLGHFQVRRCGPALVYLAEDSAHAVRERLVALCHHRRVAFEHLDVRVITAPSLHLDLDLDLERLDATLAQHTPAMLLLDPLVRMHHADENNAQEIARILGALRELQRRHNTAIVLTHHTRKNQRSQQHGQSLRGSGDLHAWVDSALYLSHHKDSLQLVIEHRNAPAPQPYALQLRGEPPRLALIDASPQDAQANLDERLLTTLRRSDTALRRTALRAMLAVNNERLGEALSSLEKLGRIRRTPDGWVA